MKARNLKNPVSKDVCVAMKMHDVFDTHNILFDDNTT